MHYSHVHWKKNISFSVSDKGVRSKVFASKREAVEKG
jgi:hypothetical protein